MKTTKHSGLLGATATLVLAATGVPVHAQDIATLAKKLDDMNAGSPPEAGVARLKADQARNAALRPRAPSRRETSRAVGSFRAPIRP